MKKFLNRAGQGLLSVATNSLVHLIFLVVVIFIGLEAAFGDAVVRLGAESARFAVFGVLSVVTLRAAWGAFWAKTWTAAEIVSIALCALAASISINALWVLVSRYVPLPPWFPEAEFSTAASIGVTMAGIGYLVPVSRYRFARTTPTASSWTSVFVAGIITGALLTLFLFRDMWA